jgi:hypothetical protein
MKTNSKVRWVGPFQMRNLLDELSHPKAIWPPQGCSAYLVTHHYWDGNPTHASAPLYVGGVTGKSDRFRIRIGDLLADMFGFYGSKRGVGHHSGGRTLHEWAMQNQIKPLDLHLAWVEDVDCHRCLEVHLHDRLRPALNRATPSRCTIHAGVAVSARRGLIARSPEKGLVWTSSPSSQTKPQSPSTRRDSQKPMEVTKYVVKPGKASDRLTHPSNYRDDSRKNHLWQIWYEHGEAATRAANGAFGTPGAPFAGPVKQSTLTG